MLSASFIRTDLIFDGRRGAPLDYWTGSTGASCRPIGEWYLDILAAAVSRPSLPSRDRYTICIEKLAQRRLGQFVPAYGLRLEHQE